MSDFPESISLEALENLQEKATKEPDPKGDGPYDGLTKGELITYVEEIMQETIAKCGDPMLHKVLVLEILSKMAEWHTAFAQEEECRSPESWNKDAGKLQACMNILLTISMSEADFTCDIDN